MKETIWKFEVQPNREDEIRVLMPKGAQVLTAREQHGTICIWAIVDPNPEVVREGRLFEIVGTGWTMRPRERKYIGTAHLDGGALVFHVFEVT